MSGLSPSLAPQVNGGELTVTVPADAPAGTFYDFGVTLASGEAGMSERTFVFTHAPPAP